MSKVVALVPLRCGSKSIPMKNIKTLAGKPLAYWVLKELSNVPEIDDVYAATDCNEVRTCIHGLSLPKVKTYDRSSENARDESSTESVLLEFILSQAFCPDDVIVLVQATMPFLKSEYVVGGLEMLSGGNHDSILSCTLFKGFLWSREGKSINYDYQRRPRRQELDETYLENGSFYISRVSDVLKNRNRIGGRIGIYEMPKHCSLDIDEPEDWQLAEAIMNSLMGVNS